MRRPLALALAPLLAAVAVAPSAAADAYEFRVVDEDGRSEDFVEGETVYFEVTADTDGSRVLDHRVHLFRGLDSSGSEIGVVDDGGRTTTSAWGATTFRVAWDQTLDGGRVGPGRYVAQYRAPDGTILETPFEIEYAPDFVVTALVARAADTPGRVDLVGCVRNDGLERVDSVQLTSSSRGAVVGSWTPQLVLEVRLHARDDGCPYAVDGGTVFKVPFESALAPGGAAVREVRVEANAFRLVWEADYADNARSAPARWLL